MQMVDLRIAANLTLLVKSIEVPLRVVKPRVTTAFYRRDAHVNTMGYVACADIVCCIRFQPSVYPGRMHLYSLAA